MCGYVSASLKRGLAKAHAARREESLTVKLVTIKKDGSPSKMYDAVKSFRTRDEAVAHASRVRELNPGRTLRYSIDGVEV